VETELREKIVIDGAEAGASKLGMLAAAAQRVAGSFHGITEIAAAAGGIAGAFKIAETIKEVDQLYQAIGRVTDIVDISAGNAHALFNMFELAGIGASSAETIITAMTRKTESLMGGVGKKTQSTTAMMKKLGITIKDGPEQRLFAMAAAAEKGKLSVSQLTTTFAIPRSQAAQMMSMLQQGPEALRKIQKDALGGAAIIDDKTLDTYEKMLQVRRELGAAWGDLVNVLYKNLLPAITAILKGIKQGFDDIAPVAEAIGKGLTKYMGLVVALTKTYLALLIAARLANMATGTQMGIGARGRQVFGLVNNAMARRATVAGGMDFFAAKAANPGIGMFATAGGPLIRILGSVVGRLGIIGAVVSVLVVAFEMLRRNTLGIRDVFAKVFGGIVSSFGSALAKVVAVLGKLWEAIRPLVAIIAGTLLLALLGLAKIVEFVGVVFDAIMTGMVAIVNGLIWLLNKIPGVDIGMIDMEAAKKAEEGKPGAPNGKSTTYQDFRGSKFEITNNFPPGIDGGRVAVVFGDELARLGERRLDSGLRPLFSYR